MIKIIIRWCVNASAKKTLASFFAIPWPVFPRQARVVFAGLITTSCFGWLVQWFKSLSVKNWKSTFGPSLDHCFGSIPVQNHIDRRVCSSCRTFFKKDLEWSSAERRATNSAKVGVGASSGCIRWLHRPLQVHQQLPVSTKEQRSTIVGWTQSGHNFTRALKIIGKVLGEKMARIPKQRLLMRSCSLWQTHESLPKIWVLALFHMSTHLLDLSFAVIVSPDVRMKLE